jgi:hypothetical protein
MTVEAKALSLRKHLGELHEMGFSDFAVELDLLDFILGTKEMYCEMASKCVVQ